MVSVLRASLVLLLLTAACGGDKKRDPLAQTRKELSESESAYDLAVTSICKRAKRCYQDEEPKNPGYCEIPFAVMPGVMSSVALTQHASDACTQDYALAHPAPYTKALDCTTAALMAHEGDLAGCPASIASMMKVVDCLAPLEVATAGCEPEEEE